MKKVRCIKKPANIYNISLGKEYEVVFEDDKYYVVRDRDDKPRAYTKDKFELVKTLFTRDDLKAGYYLVDEQDKTYVIVRSSFGLMAKRIDINHFVNEQIDIKLGLNSDLTKKDKNYNPQTNIVAVYNITEFAHNYLNIKIVRDPDRLLWKREPEVKEMTVAEIVAELGYEVKIIKE